MPLAIMFVDVGQQCVAHIDSEPTLIDISNGLALYAHLCIPTAVAVRMQRILRYSVEGKPSETSNESDSNQILEIYNLYLSVASGKH